MSTEEPGKPQTARHHHRHFPRTIIGVLLITIGASVLLEQFVHRDLHLVSLAIGVALVAAWFVDRRYWMLIAGSILVSTGVASLIGSIFPFDWASHLYLLALGGGFALIYVLTPKRSGWALIPAVVLGTIGAIQIGLNLGDLIPTNAARLILPIAIIGLGLLMITRGSMAPYVFRSIVVILVVLIVSSIANGTSLPFGFAGFETARSTREIQIPDLEGRALVLRGGSGNVQVHQGPVGATAHFTARAQKQSDARKRIDAVKISVTESTGQVAIAAETPGRVLRDMSIDYDINIPQDSSARIEVGSGDVTVDLDRAQSIRVFSGSGDLDVRGSFAETRLQTGSGDVSMVTTILNATDNLSIRTGSGDVDLTLSAPGAHISLTASSGDISTSGGWSFRGSDGSKEAEGTLGDVDVRTGSGDISLNESCNRNPVSGSTETVSPCASA